jgi:hypothetical protein
LHGVEGSRGVSVGQMDAARQGLPSGTKVPIVLLTIMARLKPRPFKAIRSDVGRASADMVRLVGW